MKDLILSRMGNRGLKRSALNLGDAEDVFRELLNGKGFKTVLEIGTYKGATAACMSQYCKRVFTIDLKQGRLEQTDPEFDRQLLWDILGVNNIELCLVSDNAEKEKLIRSLDFDFVFIDGDHSFEGVKFDFELVKHCNHILFHDYDYTGVKGKDDVWNFVNTLDRTKITVYDDIFAYYRQ